MKHLFSLLQAVFALVFSLMVGPAMADEPVTKWHLGCEWKHGANGNYLTKVDGGCKHWIGMGYDRHRDLLGQDIPDEAAAPEPEAPADDKAV